MADGSPAVSFDEIIQEGRKKRQAEKLAQEIFGKNRRSSAPPAAPKAGLGGSLASRVGVNKRNSSIPRSNTLRQPRQPPSAHLSRPPVNNNSRPRPSYTQPASAPSDDVSGNGNAREEVVNGGDGVSIRGVASDRGPYIVRAQNFAPGTTSADIQSVMFSVGGSMTYCKLIASNPTVIAEMAFDDKLGSEKVVETFNGKKADGRVLYVYVQQSRGPKATTQTTNQVPGIEPPAPALGTGEDVTMEVDENAESREVENRRREERRGTDDRTERDVFPAGPRNHQGGTSDYYDRGSRRPEPEYQDRMYGFGRGGDWYGGRGRYQREDRRYGGGPAWRR